MFYRGNKIWVQVGVRMKLITSLLASLCIGDNHGTVLELNTCIVLLEGLVTSVHMMVVIITTDRGFVSDLVFKSNINNVANYKYTADCHQYFNHHYSVTLLIF